MTEQPQNEPSMEEILASIRRIISDDPAAPPAGEGEDTQLDPPSGMPAASVAPSGILDLTPDMRADLSEPEEEEPAPTEAPMSLDEMFASAPAEPAPDPEPEPELEPEPEPEPEPKPAYTPPPPRPAPEPSAFPLPPEEHIISPQTEAAAASALAGLSATIDSRTRFEGETVEALVRELLRPMLRQWMDQNLPTLVERLVEAEIERLSRRGR